MNRLYTFFIIALMLAVMSASVKEEKEHPSVKDDTAGNVVISKGRAKGFVGDIVVELTLEKMPGNKKNFIRSIKILEANEVNIYWSKVKDKIIEEILSLQNFESLESVTGASASSKGLISAVKEAYENAEERN